MASTNDESDSSYSFLINVALAPYTKPGAKPHENAVLNSDVRFQAVVTKGAYGSVAHAARRFVEEAHSNMFLTPMINREMDESTVGSAAVELIYGDGYRTLIVRKDGPEPKSFRQVGVLLSIADDDIIEDPSTLAILMPDDDFWHHVMNTYDPYSGKGIPTVYIRTTELLFLHPTKVEHESSIAVTVSSKRGLWKGLTFDGKRSKYPDVLPKAAPRKRKHNDETPNDAPEGGTENKKAKIEDEKKKDDASDEEESEDESEEKPTIKKTPSKSTPSKKKPPKKEHDDEDDSEESPEIAKPKKKAAAKKKEPKKVKKEEGSDTREKEESKKAKRKSSGSAKAKASKEKK